MQKLLQIQFAEEHSPPLPWEYSYRAAWSGGPDRFQTNVVLRASLVNAAQTARGCTHPESQIPRTSLGGGWKKQLQEHVLGFNTSDRAGWVLKLSVKEKGKSKCVALYRSQP